MDGPLKALSEEYNMAGRILYTGGIVKDGLVFHLDAAKVDSYPKSGTSWTNLSQTNITGSLLNNPVFSSDNGGTIVFDGTDDFVRFGSTFTTLDLVDKSFQCWVNKVGASARGVIDKDFDGGGTNYGGWGFWVQSNNKLTFWVHRLKDLNDDGSNTITLGQWTNIAVTYNSTTKSATFYINGNVNSTKTDATIVEKSSGTTQLVVATIRNNTIANRAFDGSISNVLAYTRILSASEILQNYNALRGRYGV